MRTPQQDSHSLINQIMLAQSAGEALPVADDDTASITSDKTDSTAQITDGEEGLSEMETYEQKVREAMDLALEKSVQTRTNALTALTTAFQKRVMTQFLLDNYQTITDLVERSLRKGRGPEQVAAARLATTLVVSLSPVAEAEKGNGELPNHPPAVSAMHTAALNGFCLLLCLLSPTTIYTMANKLVKEMFDLLGSSDLDLRIQAGEAVALIYETARIHDEDYSWNREADLCSVLKELATDSHRFRAKKDRKQQRASFRDVVRTVEEGEQLYETVFVGPQNQRQELILDTWSLKWQYSSLCHIIGQGISVHISYNIGIRDIFALGPPPIQMDHGMALLARKTQKRPNRESPASKARQMARNKNRDNRQAAKVYED
ncbi:interferon-related developmental regulator 1 [Penaeus vannamei]|uniref:Interferon-related developmental regulator 1 n=1 Tax=Penaeus vannamei TaxID=6689 RepID=A0A423TLU5_PENVA|nr:interferon-related developmental regulator 1 [Penaeus vannamei]